MTTETWIEFIVAAFILGAVVGHRFLPPRLR
jgi:hypothetical protein